MKSLLTFLVTFLIVISAVIIFYEPNEIVEINENNDNEQMSETDSSEPKVEDETVDNQNMTHDESDNTSTNENTVETFSEWMFEDIENVYAHYGEPDRVDQTPFGYDWLIYTRDNSYKQFGVNDGLVVTLFTNSQEENLGDITIGDKYSAISAIYPIESQVRMNSNNSTYTFDLTKEELKSRPLVKIDEQYWAQLYFDTFKEELSSIRYLEKDVLLVHRPYSITYSGDLPNPNKLADEDLKKWQEGQASQIFDLTNAFREKHQLQELLWDEDTAYVAYLHSKDMKDEGFFSHTSPRNGDLRDRLEQESVTFQMAAENIAAKYVDGIEAVEGWINSEGHRVNLLSPELSHLGVGVYKDYYTQNFLKQ